MTALIYTLLFAGVLCVGTCLGFFLACLLKSDKQNYKAGYLHLKEENETLSLENSRLESLLHGVQEITKKYFGDIPK